MELGSGLARWRFVALPLAVSLLSCSVRSEADLGAKLTGYGADYGGRGGQLTGLVSFAGLVAAIATAATVIPSLSGNVEYTPPESCGGTLSILSDIAWPGGESPAAAFRLVTPADSERSALIAEQPWGALDWVHPSIGDFVFDFGEGRLWEPLRGTLGIGDLGDHLGLKLYVPNVGQATEDFAVTARLAEPVDKAWQAKVERAIARHCSADDAGCDGGDLIRAVLTDGEAVDEAMPIDSGAKAHFPAPSELSAMLPSEGAADEAEPGSLTWLEGRNQGHRDVAVAFYLFGPEENPGYVMTLAYFDRFAAVGDEIKNPSGVLGLPAHEAFHPSAGNLVVGVMTFMPGGTVFQLPPEPVKPTAPEGEDGSLGIPPAGGAPPMRDHASWPAGVMVIKTVAELNAKTAPPPVPESYFSPEDQATFESALSTYDQQRADYDAVNSVRDGLYVAAASATCPVSKATTP